jgi:hypothetical protein
MILCKGWVGERAFAEGGMKSVDNYAPTANMTFVRHYKPLLCLNLAVYAKNMLEMLNNIAHSVFNQGALYF